MNAEPETRRIQIYRWWGHKDGKERLYFVDRALELMRQEKERKEQ